MKCFKTLAYVSMAALVSVAGFTSCSSEEELNAPKTTAQQAEGEYNGEEVKTEFSISLPQQATRQNMPGTTVQKNGLTDFQGMTDITLVPFARQATTSEPTGKILSTDTRLGNAISLSDISAGTTENPSLVGPSHAKVYSNVSIPLTTASFLFYARSAKTGTKFQIGSLSPVISSTNTMTTSTTPAGIEFDLEPIVSAVGTPTAAGSKGESLIAYLNSVANATDGTTAWKNYTADQSAAMTALFETYSSNHSLSSFQVQRMMTDLYKSLMPLSSDIANAIKAAIATTSGHTYASVDASGNVTLNSELQGFPANHNLPEGSVRVTYASGAFRGCTEQEYTDANNAPVNLYTYPAQLWYYANSVIKTSNSSKKDLYNSTNNWAYILGQHEAAPAVNSLTRAVAIKDAIQYAVARLDVIVKLATDGLEDNAPTPVTISHNAYPVTAILVGGQKNVNFDFTPKGTTEYTIYDNEMSATITASTTNTTANSTLVMESEVGSTKDIMVAVELENNSGHDFIGAGGQLIPNGSKFYMVGKLSAAASAQKTNDVLTNQVFKQDYTTTATLTAKNLKNAYNTIPDLRTPQLELGFSVDLDWQAGNVYNVDLD